MTNKRERILKGILNNLHYSFFSYSALIMMVDYIRNKREGKVALNLFKKKITNIKNVIPENIKTINHYHSWLKKECQNLKVPFNEMSEVTFTLSKKPGKFLFIIPTNCWKYKTIIKTKNKTLSKESSSKGWW